MRVKKKFHNVTIESDHEIEDECLLLAEERCDSSDCPVVRGVGARHSKRHHRTLPAARLIQRNNSNNCSVVRARSVLGWGWCKERREKEVGWKKKFEKERKRKKEKRKEKKNNGKQ